MFAYDAVTDRPLGLKRNWKYNVRKFQVLPLILCLYVALAGNCRGDSLVNQIRFTPSTYECSKNILGFEIKVIDITLEVRV